MSKYNAIFINSLPSDSRTKDSLIGDTKRFIKKNSKMQPKYQRSFAELWINQLNIKLLPWDLLSGAQHELFDSLKQLLYLILIQT